MEPGTSWVSPPSDESSVFKTEAFRYFGSSNKVYVQCLVRVCLDTQQSDECKLCSSKRKRRNAEAESNEGQTILVKTPVFYIIDRGEISCVISSVSS